MNVEIINGITITNADNELFWEDKTVQDFQEELEDMMFDLNKRLDQGKADVMNVMNEVRNLYVKITNDEDASLEKYKGEYFKLVYNFLDAL